MSAFQFSANWDSWERHPAGVEWVCLLRGSATLLLQEAAGMERHALNHPGDFVLIPAGIWHTADTQTDCVLLFMTPGKGTEHQSRHSGVAE